MKKMLMLRTLAIAAVSGLWFGCFIPNKIMAQDAASSSPAAPASTAPASTPAASPSGVPVFDRGAFIDASGTGGFIKMEFINMSTAAPSLYLLRSMSMAGTTARHSEAFAARHS